MSQAQILSIAVPGASGLLGAMSVAQAAAGGVLIYRGFALRNTSVGGAIVQIHEAGSGGKVLETIQFTATGSAGASLQWQYEPGMRCVGDLYVEIVSGTYVGTIRYS